MVAQLKARAISSRELMTAHIRRIEEVNPLLNAVVVPLFDSAMAAAEDADRRLMRGEETGVLHGVPISIKDSIDVEGVRTTAGTIGRKNARPAAVDATLVARLRRAGAIPVAKTNLPDLLFAYESDNLLFGRTNNPYDQSRTPGGSSGGESALLASGGSALGLGSDAAGSVRLPAAFCGIASLKPTSGRLPRTGHVPPAGGWVEELWQIGPMARQVADLELALSLLAAPDGEDFTSPPVPLLSPPDLRGLRLAMFTHNGFAPCTDEVVETVKFAARALEGAGMRIEETMPPGMGHAYDLEMDLLGADGCAGLDAYAVAQGSASLHPLLMSGFLQRIRARACRTPDLSTLWGRWDAFRVEMTQFFRTYDAILCPVYTQTALKHGASTEETNFRGFSYTMAWNVAGLPAATVRCGEANGLPVNVQIVTARWQDRLALKICRALELACGGFVAPHLP